MSSNQNTIYKGGKILGKGAYGCISYPSYSCSSKSKPSKSSVSKLSTIDKFNPDTQIYKYLRKIKNYTKHFIFPKKICNIPSSRISIEDSKKCKMLKPYKNKTIVNSIMTKGDHDLSEIKKLSLSKTKKYSKHLLIGIQKLTHYNIAHLDIKSMNIIIRKNIPYYIDFDDTFNPRNWIDFRNFLNDFSYLTDEYIWPPEIYHYFPYFAMKTPDYIYAYLDNITWESYIEKIMVFQLGNSIKKLNNNKKFKYLIAMMTDPNPYRRYNIKQSLSFLAKI